MIRTIGKWLGRLILALASFVAALWLFGPREPVETAVTFDASQLGGDLDAWLAEREATVPALRPALAKRIRWAGSPGVRTDWVVVYVHGYSASSEEIRPVPDGVAEALGANLYFARLKGHGRDGAAMAEATVGDWVRDFAEAMAIGRALGDRILVLSTSTGGTLSALAAQDTALVAGVAGMAMISPNFRVQGASARLLTWPAVRWWGPVVAGETRRYEPLSAAHAAGVTNEYPLVALLPMAALVKHVDGLNHTSAKLPLLVVLDPGDRVVDPGATRRVAADWGGPVRFEEIDATGDPYRHVIAGDAQSPAMTAPVTAIVLDWARGL